MANDDEDTKTGKRPSSRPPEGDSEDKSPSEKLVEAATEGAEAKTQLAEAKAEADPDERKAEAEAAAEEAERTKEDALEAEEAAEEAGDENTAAAAEMTAAEAEKTRAEALEAAAEAEAEIKEAEAEAAGAGTEEDSDEAADTNVLGEGVPETRPALFLAEYESPDDLVRAAETVRDAGYEKWDCHTPYAIHGMDDAMGLPPTKIGFISFICGMVGLASAVLMIQYMNNWDYPLIIGGKPPGAFPSMVPIMFELTVLLTGFGTLFGLFHLCRLPRHHHPIFESDRFEASTDDRFFISIEVEDPKFDLGKTRALLENTHPSHLELVEEEIA